MVLRREPAFTLTRAQRKYFTDRRVEKRPDSYNAKTDRFGSYIESYVPHSRGIY